eukprot:comp21165_c0_seq1/m.28670 comp21165_c0_seq1/g.28670  ORF comp21165_c0_seq1/g.28670 comp21165_c0_seq1/m.28670 type:complete len:282 (-) comp21165_c0_seq1:227-1072(-)
MNTTRLFTTSLRALFPLAHRPHTALMRLPASLCHRVFSTRTHTYKSTTNTQRPHYWGYICGSFLGLGGGVAFSEAATQTENVSVRKESSTGLEFPEVLPGEYGLVGLGVRALTIFQISTYVVGMYVPTDKETTRQLKEMKENSKGVSTPDFATKFAESTSVKKLFVLKPTKSSRGGHLRDAFGRMLEGRLPTTLNPEELKEAKSLVEEFKRAFPKSDLPAGDTVKISIGDGVLAIEHKGEVTGSIKSDLLCRIFVDAYIGANPVSPKAKESIFQGFEQRLA